MQHDISHPYPGLFVTIYFKFLPNEERTAMFQLFYVLRLLWMPAATSTSTLRFASCAHESDARELIWLILILRLHWLAGLH